jgi:hypothetical protein
VSVNNGRRTNSSRNPGVDDTGLSIRKQWISTRQANKYDSKFLIWVAAIHGGFLRQYQQTSFLLFLCSFLRLLASLLLSQMLNMTNCYGWRSANLFGQRVDVVSQEVKNRLRRTKSENG